MTQLLSQFVDFLGAHQMLAILFAFLVAFDEVLLILGLFVPSTTFIRMDATDQRMVLPVWGTQTVV